MVLDTKRLVVWQFVSVGLVLSSALAMWKVLVVLTNNGSPIVVVLSGSMEPGFQRGDLLFLHMDDEPIAPGEVVVYKLKDKDIPIVHRVMKLHSGDDGYGILTKGDNNKYDDRGLYEPFGEKQLLQRPEIVGKAYGFVPYVGWATLMMNEYPPLKFALLLVLSLFAFFEAR